MNDLVKQPEASPDSGMFALISRAASDPNVDVDKFMRLKQMLDEDEARKAERAFNDALSDCQSEIGTVGVNKTNAQTRSQYATYDKLDRVVRPVYTRHGFALSFDTASAKKDEDIRVLCYVSHKSGHKRTYSVDMPADGKGAKGGDVMTKTHAAGSAMSYGQRYLLKLIFNVATGEHDDDGNAAGNTAAYEGWHLAIEQAESMEALTKIGEKLKAEQGIPQAAMRSIRTTWARRAKELKPAAESHGEEE